MSSYGINNVARWVGLPCVYCYEPMLHRFECHDRAPTRDHIVPTSRGGSKRAMNIAICCRRCNNDKGNMLPQEWHRRLAKDGDGRAVHVLRFLDNGCNPVAAETEADKATQEKLLQKLFEYFERVDNRPKRHIRHANDYDEPARHPIGDQPEARRDAVDDEGRSPDSAG